jgi:hypothetical protein
MTLDKRLIAIGALAVLAIGLFLVARFVKFDKDEEEDAIVEVEQVEPLFPDEFGNVTAVQVTDNQTGQTFRANRPEGGSWEIVEAVEGSDAGLGVDEAQLSMPLYSLPGLTPTRVLNDVERLSDFGLEDVFYTISFETNIGTSHTFYVGSKNPGGDAYYVQLPNDSQVYLVSSYALEPLLGFVENPPYIQPTPDPNATETDTDTEDEDEDGTVSG